MYLKKIKISFHFHFRFFSDLSAWANSTSLLKFRTPSLRRTRSSRQKSRLTRDRTRRRPRSTWGRAPTTTGSTLTHTSGTSRARRVNPSLLCVLLWEGKSYPGKQKMRKKTLLKLTWRYLPTPNSFWIDDILHCKIK